MPEENVLDTFLSDLPEAEKQTDFFAEEPKPEIVVEEPKAEEVHVNRRDRRLEAKYQQEREANIELTTRLAVLSEREKFARDTSSITPDADLLTLYGTDDNGRRAAEITQRLLERTKEEATATALERFQAQQEAERQEVGNQEKVLDSMLEEIEDEHNVDLTSNSPTARKARQEFFSLLEKVSPKDSEGRVKDFADPLSTWEIYQAQKEKSQDTNRAKDLASRSMVRSGASTDTKLESSVTERYLRDAGII